MGHSLELQNSSNRSDMRKNFPAGKNDSDTLVIVGDAKVCVGHMVNNEAVSFLTLSMLN